jgi:hypothetical protein
MGRNSAGVAGLVAVCMLAGCAAPPAGPPLGGPTADVGFLPPGATWEVRTTDQTSGSISEEQRTTTSMEYKGRKVLGTTSGGLVYLSDPATRNGLAVMRDGKEDRTWSPDSGEFSWPLWVGKEWQPRYSGVDVVNHKSWSVVEPRMRVEAYEDVIVPAGTFKAFRIQTSPGIMYANSSTDWYAPEVKMIVKKIWHGNNARGVQETTSELLTRPK